jgi:menaquinone-9 beta-reductase
MFDLDCAIVGTGPAGAAAAVAARAGLRVVLFESRALPRVKPCGGAMPAAAIALFTDFGRDIEPNIRRRIFQYRNLFEYELPQDSGELTTPVLMVDHPSFDLAGVEYASGCGAVDVRDNTTVRNIAESPTDVILTTDTGERIAVPFVILANGARSRLCASLGLNEGAPYGLAIDAELTVDDVTWALEGGRATFNFGCVPGGYGWIFPQRRPT